MNKEQAEQILINLIDNLKLTTQERHTLINAVMILKAQNALQEVKKE